MIILIKSLRDFDAEVYLVELREMRGTRPLNIMFDRYIFLPHYAQYHRIMDFNLQGNKPLRINDDLIAS